MEIIVSELRICYKRSYFIKDALKSTNVLEFIFGQLLTS